MSSGDHGAIRVERCISKRMGGTFSVEIWDGTRSIKRSFKKLKEARAFREEIVKRRTGMVKDWNVTGMGLVNRTGYLPSDVVQHRKDIRKQIDSAPRSTVYRDGKKFTLIELPEVLT